MVLSLLSLRDFDKEIFLDSLETIKNILKISFT